MIELTAENIQYYSRNCVLYDIETTGLSSVNDAIIELSALKVVDGQVTDEFSSMVNPHMHISEAASAINGITDAMVKDAPDIDQVIKKFKAFTEGAVLAGHNIKNFDLRFIQRDALRCLGKELKNEYIDTVLIARRYLPDLSSRALGALAEYYGVSYEGAHRALADCRINLEVFGHLAMEAGHPSAAAKNVKVCPQCGNPLKLRNGKYGEFYGCTAYPECKFTQDAGDSCR